MINPGELKATGAMPGQQTSNEEILLLYEPK